MRNSTMGVVLEEAAARSGLAEDGAGMARLLHTPHADARVRLCALGSEPATADLSGATITERGSI